MSLVCLLLFLLLLLPLFTFSLCHFFLRRRQSVCKYEVSKSDDSSFEGMTKGVERSKGNERRLASIVSSFLFFLFRLFSSLFLLSIHPSIHPAACFFPRFGRHAARREGICHREIEVHPEPFEGRECGMALGAVGWVGQLEGSVIFVSSGGLFVISLFPFLFFHCVSASARTCAFEWRVELSVWKETNRLHCQGGCKERREAAVRVEV